MRVNRVPKSKVNGLTLAVILLAGSLLLAGCSHQSAPSAPPIPSAPLPAPSQPPFSGNLTIYQLSSADSSEHADENGLVPVVIKVDPSSRNLARLALNALASSSETPLPTGTKILSVDIDSGTGLATVDFSHEFKDEFQGGDTREAQVLNSVLETLGQFPTIQNVQFLVEGAKIDSLGGTQDLSTPLPVVKSTSEASAGA